MQGHGVARRWAMLGTMGLGLLAAAALAQHIPRPPGPPVPRIYSVMPGGGRPGTSIEVSVSGLDLDEPEGLLFSEPGISAEPIKLPEAPPDQAKPKNQRRGLQGLLGPVTTRGFRVTLPADASPGFLDVRLINRWGVSNPRTFVIGDLSEVVEREPNNDVGEAQRLTVGTTVSGAIGSPTDVDDFVFEGRAGQRVLASGLASSIDSRLLLALELFDAAGKKLAANHEYQGTDALLDAVLPADGDYLLRAFAFTYSQGGPEHFYRISLTTAPWIDAVFPPVIEPGETAEVTVYGRNLPGGTPNPGAVVDGHPLETLKTTIEAPFDSQDLDYRGFVPPGSSGLNGFEYRLRNAARVSNPYLITLAKAPVVLDRGNNETPETAQEIAVPCEIAGRIEARRDRDWYAFKAKKGDVLSIEAFGARLGSAIDLYFALRNAQTKQLLGEFDDETNPRNQRQDQAAVEARNQFFTRTEDPDRYRFTAPADGRYELLVSSREAPSLAEPRHLYCVRITAEQPDFRLVVMPGATTYPDALVLGRGGESEATVFVGRDDGFNDEIALSALDLPPGVTCPPQVVGTGQRHGTLIFSASADAASWVGAIRVIGTATIAGKAVVRAARPATITWPVLPQQNIPTISRLDRSFALAVRDQAPFRVAPEVASLTVTHGEKATVPLKLIRSGNFDGAVQNAVVTNVPQPLASAINVSMTKDSGKAVLDIKPNVPPGVYSLVFRAQAQVPMVLDPKTKTKTNVAMTQPSPPVTLTVLPKELARVSLAPANGSVKPGQSMEVKVRVARQYDFAGEFVIELVVPTDANGIKAERVKIPAGQDEATLAIAIDPGAKPGNLSGLIVRATAQYRGTLGVTQEAKLSLNVTR